MKLSRNDWNVDQMEVINKVYPAIEQKVKDHEKLTESEIKTMVSDALHGMDHKPLNYTQMSDMSTELVRLMNEIS